VAVEASPSARLDAADAGEDVDAADAADAVDAAAAADAGRGEADPAGWREALRVGLGLWALTRIAFLAFAVGARLALPDGLSRRQPGWLARLYYQYDSLNFFSIAAGGYNVGTTHPTGGPHNPAFFPGYPVLARIFAMPFGGLHPGGVPLYWSLAVVAWLGAAAAAVLLWRLAAVQAGPLVANRAVLLLLVGPYAVFLMASYSEGVFLAFAIGSWYAGYRRHWWLAGVLGALAGLVRINGLFLGAGLIVMFALQWRSADRRPSRTSAAALVLPLLGPFAYFAWLRVYTGSWRTWFNAQEYWNRHFTWPWTSLANTIHHISQPRGTRLVPALEVVFAVIAVAVLVVLLLRRRWPEAVYVGLSVVSMTTSPWFLSLPRLCLLLFPAFVLLADVSRRWRWAWPVMLTGSVTLLAINSVTLVYGQWVA
jgi:hypothetical protein